MQVTYSQVILGGLPQINPYIESPIVDEEMKSCGMNHTYVTLVEYM